MYGPCEYTSVYVKHENTVTSLVTDNAYATIHIGGLRGYVRILNYSQEGCALPQI